LSVIGAWAIVLSRAKLDAAQMIDSRNRLHAMRDWGALVITGHDLEMWEKVPQAPARLRFAWPLTTRGAPRQGANASWEIGLQEKL
jgi:hypothetical protein